MRRAPLIWLGSAARRRLLDEADARHPDETGGLIIGYRAGQDEYVVTAVSGPGPRAVHTPTRFDPDHDYQVDWLARRYTASNRVETYLGDWHTHPNAKTAVPSRTDGRVAAAIADYRDARATIPIIMIANGSRGNWWLHAWTYEVRPAFAVFRRRCFVKGSVFDYTN